MKHALFVWVALFLLGCANQENRVRIKMTQATIEPENPLNALQYDNKIDFYCNMDITRYGVADTLHYKGKLYGFCSKMCKEAVKKHPQAYNIEPTR